MNSSVSAAGRRARNPIYEIMKGIGIFAVVIGHCPPNSAIHDLVYSFHLALFFFISGLQFNDRKYANDPYQLLQNRVKSMWPAYFGYTTFFTLIHNLSLKLCLIPEQAYYSAPDSASRILKNFLFMADEMLGGALWFIPVQLISLLLFGFILYNATVFVNRYRVPVLVVGCCLLGVAGLYYIRQNHGLIWHAQTSLLMMPVLCAGYLFSLYRLNLKKAVRFIIAIPAIFISVWLVLGQGYRVELSANVVPGGFIFYLLSFLGIYAVCFLAEMISRLDWSCRLFSFIGRHSFDIMALHFLVFKFIDAVFGRLRGDAPEIYRAFPCSYPSLWPFYLLASIIVCPFIRILLQKLYQQLLRCADCWFGSSSVKSSNES